MFEPKRETQRNLANYIGARVTDAEEKWLRAEMKRRKLTMSDLIRRALGKLHAEPTSLRPRDPIFAEAPALRHDLQRGDRDPQDGTP